MRSRSAFSSGLLLGSAFAVGQQSLLVNTPEPAATPSIYYAGPGVTAPELLPVMLTNGATGRCDHLDGTVILSALVDSFGVPHNIYFLAPAGNDLDKQAIRVLAAERFKPGTHAGQPAAVNVAIEMDIQACIEEKTNGAGQEVHMLQLRSAPAQKVTIQQPPPIGATHAPKDSMVTLPDASDNASRDATVKAAPPKLLKYVAPDIPDNFRGKKINGTCLIGLTVDANGMPKDVHVTKSLSPDFDPYALNAVRQYRFRPALKDGTIPVAVKINVEVDLHLH